MENKQDFYIAFTDSTEPPDPVGCWIKKNCEYKERKNLFLIKLDRIIRIYSDPFHYEEYEFFFLAPKYEDENPLLISDWPIEVYLMKLNKEPEFYSGDISDQELKIELWATIFKEMKEARQVTKNKRHEFG